MKQFKKRTIALVLASVVTVVGAFGADRYKNSLMAVDFDTAQDGSVNMVLQTKTPYAGSLTPVKKDAYTYVLMLPEVNSMASTPDLTKASHIESVDVKTMPYSNYGKGYLKIVVKTSSASAMLTASNKIFISDNKPEKPSLPEKSVQTQTSIPKADNQATAVEKLKLQEKETYRYVEEPAVQHNVSEEHNPAQDREIESAPAPVIQDSSTEVKRTESYEAFLLVMGIFLILVVSTFCYVKAKNKMREIAGESLNIDVDDDSEKSKKKSKIKKITKTIKNLDTAYPKPSAKVSFEPPKQSVAPADNPMDDLNIVDLDELFQEHKAQKSNDASEEENDALEDFLSGFSFDDSAEENKAISEPEEEPFDEELFQKALNNKELNFTKEDAERIHKLLKMEITDDTMRNINRFAVSTPIKKVPSSKQVLENLVTTYAVTQNVHFTQEDINNLYKLINVEIDSDFITDLRTNPERTEEMRKEIEASSDALRKPREIITLNVKDMLPDLSEELKKQGGRKIESEARPTVVYASEGYDVNILSLNDALPDLSKEINNKESYINKPSSEIQYADNTYDVDVLNINSELPDLKDVMANPEKYEEAKIEEPIADEDTLLKNISNVQFKPFYDGSEEIEIINDLTKSENSSFSAVQQEFDSFDNFEVVEEEVIPESTNNIQEEHDDFQALYSREYVDLDKDKNEESANNTKEEFVPAKLHRAHSKSSVNHIKKNVSKDIIEKILQSRKQRNTRVPERVTSKKNAEKKEVVQKNIKCILEGETYTIVSTTEFGDDMGCHLAKNENGYVVLAYAGDKISKIKEYKSLKSERIQARQSDKLPDGSIKYIIRIGANKFIVNVKDKQIDYVMDLC